MPGGKCYLQLSPTALSKATLRWVDGKAKAGILTASPGKGEGSLNAVAHSYGTSHAAARLSHDTEMAYIILKQLQLEHGLESLPDIYFPVLIKALLAHGAELGEMETMLAEKWGIDLKTHGGREEIARTVGYGLPDINKTILCNEMKATLVGFGEMYHDDAHEYSIAVPDELSGRRFSRTLRYTIAALSPINPRSFDYHAYRIEAELIAPSTNECFGMTRVGTAGGHGWRLSEKGLLLHHVWFGNTGTKYPANSELKIKISCKSTNKTEARPLRYGLVASFAIQEEVASQTFSLISVYSRIVNAIKSRIRTSS